MRNRGRDEALGVKGSTVGEDYGEKERLKAEEWTERKGREKRKK